MDAIFQKIKPYSKHLIIGLIIVLVATATYLILNRPSSNTVIKHTFGDYTIEEYPYLLTKQECERIMDAAVKHGMKPSDVLSYGSGSDTEVNTTYRTSVQAWLPDEADPIFAKLAQIASARTGIPINHQEMSQVVKYDEGGKFDEHYDPCVYNDKEYCDRINNYAGQRRATLLMYLNDDYEGGETEFLEVGLKIKPKQGKAILFWSTDNNEQLLLKSKHKAHPVKGGNKWIVTKWVHQKEWKHAPAMPPPPA